jgi:hypothetical protein
LSSAIAIKALSALSSRRSRKLFLSPVYVNVC